MIDAMHKLMATLTSPGTTLRWWSWLRVKSASGGTRLVQHPRRIVVIRLDGIGDAVLTSPLLRALRKNFGHAEITVVVRPSAYELLARCPYVDRLLSFDPVSRGRLVNLRRQMQIIRFCHRNWRGGGSGRSSFASLGCRRGRSRLTCLFFRRAKAHRLRFRNPAPTIRKHRGG